MSVYFMRFGKAVKVGYSISGGVERAKAIQRLIDRADQVRELWPKILLQEAGCRDDRISVEHEFWPAEGVSDFEAERILHGVLRECRLPRWWTRAQDRWVPWTGLGSAWDGPREWFWDGPEVRDVMRQVGWG